MMEAMQPPRTPARAMCAPKHISATVMNRKWCGLVLRRFACDPMPTMTASDRARALSTLVSITSGPRRARSRVP